MDDAHEAPPMPDWLRVRCEVLAWMRTAYRGHWWRRTRGEPVWNYPPAASSRRASGTSWSVTVGFA